MFSGIRADSNRSAMEIREAAALRQQRRIKQAVQFLHKDSADLLPLDGLKKLGTSKEGQPHNILQRRLLEANLSRNRLNNRGVKPSYNSQALSRPLHNDTQEEESDLIRVVCQCLGKEVTVMLNTGCVVNLISSVSVEKLGLKEKVIQTKNETDLGPFQRNLQTVGHIELNLNFGQTKAECTFTVIENDRPCISIGTKTLKSLKCVIDTEKQMLVLGKDTREQIQFTGASHETEASSE